MLSFGIADYDRNFAANWRRAVAGYKDTDNTVWLAGPTAYLLSVDGVKFAVDPQVRRPQDLGLVADTLVEDLKDLAFVLISHQHNDHMCLPLMQLLRETDIQWVIPAGTRKDLIEKSGLRRECITFISPGEALTLQGLTVRAFHTPHRPDGSFFPQCGYWVQAPSGSLLFPGDIRDLDYCGYPNFGAPDLCFSHLWAGNDALTPENYHPLLQKFAVRSSEFGAKRYFFAISTRSAGKRSFYGPTAMRGRRWIYSTVSAPKQR